MQKIVGVRRSGDKNLYFFLPNEEYNVGDKVVVQFDDFQTVATVVKVANESDDTKAYELEKIKRRASEKDLKQYSELSEKAKSFIPSIKKKSLELGLMMKFVSAEYSLDGTKILIVFSSEERVDFRQLLKELASMLKVRIELKQIGQRDEVKVSGGVGPCGQPCCCARFLKDFEHVTVKMAKIQGLSLSPTKINGVCGRLMCCLGYESETYEKILATMPKNGEEVISPNGRGTAEYNDILRERVSVRRKEGDAFVVEDFDLDEIIFGEKIKEYNAHPERFNLKKKEKQVETKPEETDNQKIAHNEPENQNRPESKPQETRREFNERKDNQQNRHGKPNNHNNEKFNQNNSNKSSEKYGITFESAETAQAEHEAEQRRLSEQNKTDKTIEGSQKKPFRKSFSGKNRHRHFGK